MAQISFLANAALSSDVRWWKATNLAIHLINGAFVYLLVVQLLKLGGVSLARAQVAALFTAGVWLVHPLQISTVMYTVQRMTELATLFSLLGMLMYVRGRQSTGRLASAAIVCAFVLCTPLAGLAKETGFLLPFLLAAIEWLLLSRNQERPKWLLSMFGLCALAPALIALLYLAGDIEKNLLGAYAIRDFSLTERILTEPGILLAYLRMILLPQRLQLGFYHDDVVIVRDLLDTPATLLSLVAVSTLVIAIFALRRRQPLIALGLALFFIGHALESTIFGLELMFEHRNYLPALGIILAMVAMVEQNIDQRLASTIGLVMLALFSFVTAGQAHLWGDEARLYSSFVDAHPASKRARATLAEWHTVHGQFDTALAVLKDVPGLTAALYRLRIGCAQGGLVENKVKPVLAAVDEAQRLDSFALDTLKLIAQETADGRCPLAASAVADALDSALRSAMRPAQRYLLTIEAARMRHSSGDISKAQLMLARAAALAPDDPFPWYLAAEWAVDSGSQRDANRYLVRARERAKHGRADFTGIDSAVDAMIVR